MFVLLHWHSMDGTTRGVVLLIICTLTISSIVISWMYSLHTILNTNDDKFSMMKKSSPQAADEHHKGKKEKSDDNCSCCTELAKIAKLTEKQSSEKTQQATALSSTMAPEVPIVPTEIPQVPSTTPGQDSAYPTAKVGQMADATTYSPILTASPSPSINPSQSPNSQNLNPQSIPAVSTDVQPNNPSIPVITTSATATATQPQVQNQVTTGSVSTKMEGERVASVSSDTMNANKALADIFNNMTEERLRDNSIPNASLTTQSLQPDIANIAATSATTSSLPGPGPTADNKVISTIVPSVNGAHQYVLNMKDKLDAQPVGKPFVSPEKLVPWNYWNYERFKKIAKPTDEIAMSQTKATPLFDTTNNMGVDNNIISKVRGLLDI